MACRAKVRDLPQAVQACKLLQRAVGCSRSLTTSATVFRGRGQRPRDLEHRRDNQPWMGFPSPHDDPFRLLADDEEVVPTHLTPREKVLWLLKQGRHNYDPGVNLAPAVEELIESNATGDPGKAALELCQGSWEVFYAPHLFQLARSIGTRFDPICYSLEYGYLTAAVKIRNPVWRHAVLWMRAAGSMYTFDERHVGINFCRTWLEWPDGEFLPKTTEDGAYEIQSLDELKVENTLEVIGKEWFFPNHAKFPVLYVDRDLAVLHVRPLNSPVALRRILAEG